jgi:hypothetical protein
MCGEEAVPWMKVVSHECEDITHPYSIDVARRYDMRIIALVDAHAFDEYRYAKRPTV